MSFMTHDIRYDRFLEVDDRQGSTFIPMDLFRWKPGQSLPSTDVIQPYVDHRLGPVVELTMHHAFFARLSAPGYTDQTDWSGPFKDWDDAARHLIQTHGRSDCGDETMEDWEKELTEALREDDKKLDIDTKDPYAVLGFMLGSILTSFEQSSLYDDYQTYEGYTDTQWGEMMGVLSVMWFGLEKIEKKTKETQSFTEDLDNMNGRDEIDIRALAHFRSYAEGLRDALAMLRGETADQA